ncbi:MAG TPA: type II toxin-antitoxin system VapC family toxin [Rhodanobacteraceae bacterium]|jgi:predicted nucleic acid-binding protein
MGALTIDASVAVRIVRDGSTHASTLDRISAADAVYAPSLFVVETANALWKYVKANLLSDADAIVMHQNASMLIDRSVENAELFPEALVLAAQTGHPVYDSLYLVTARRTGSTLLTFDKVLAKIARKLDIDVEMD